MKHSIQQYHYDLPEELIAKHPCENRSDSRLLCVNKDNSALSHHHMYDFHQLINPEDLLIFNNSKVIPARIFGIKASGGKIEVLVERLLDPHHALVHIKSSKTPKVGTELYLGEDNSLHCTVTAREGDLFKIKCHVETPLLDLLEQHGHIPLPPYINREDQASDITRYQTIYAEPKGSVAAPTAGLHFDEALLNAIKAKGVRTSFVTLHVGAGTFQPVRIDDITQHHMHCEWIEVSAETCDSVRACKKRGGRVIAVGTTSVRCLESANHEAYQGETDIFIYPGYSFNTVDALLTNFHLPRSTLLMLVSAFAGRDNILHAYNTAIEEQYRFFSYGDAMFIS